MRVSAGSACDDVENATVRSDRTIVVRMKQRTCPLSIRANVRTARVAVNGVSRGIVAFSEHLPPGTCNVKVPARGSARGFTDCVADGF